jgi:hypothetical protein
MAMDANKTKDFAARSLKIIESGISLCGKYHGTAVECCDTIRPLFSADESSPKVFSDRLQIMGLMQGNLLSLEASCVNIGKQIVDMNNYPLTLDLDDGDFSCMCDALRRLAMAYEKMCEACRELKALMEAKNAIDKK